ncbi:MAG: hypothetical protein PHO65_01800 [Sulfurovum sp.]|nr:hypothetical protein [Sulfurovum sp.]
MASYTVRVVLHDAEWDHYNKLYTEMSREGFSDEIISTHSKKTYKFPDGEYNIG